MNKHVLMLTSCAFILAFGAVGAGAERLRFSWPPRVTP